MSPLLELYTNLAKNVSTRNQILKSILVGRMEDIPTHEGKLWRWGHIKGILKQRYEHLGDHLWGSANESDRKASEKIAVQLVIEDMPKLKRIFFGEASIDTLDDTAASETSREEDENEILCDNSGKCQAPRGARDITNCIYCGKELREKDGHWFTWDADTVKNPISQGPVI